MGNHSGGYCIDHKQGIICNTAKSNGGFRKRLIRLNDLSMPIPAFDSNSVLPPHIGDPRDESQLSPYLCTSVELCERFATSEQRVSILTGFLGFRQRLEAYRPMRGFQWLDGSFLENIESLEGRDPNDLDVVTFYSTTSDVNSSIGAGFHEFSDRDLSIQNFRIDHFAVDIEFDSFLTVEMSRYWTGLFSHRR